MNTSDPFHEARETWYDRWLTGQTPDDAPDQITQITEALLALPALDRVDRDDRVVSTSGRERYTRVTVGTNPEPVTVGLLTELAVHLALSQGERDTHDPEEVTPQVVADWLESWAEDLADPGGSQAQMLEHVTRVVIWALHDEFGR